MPTDLPVRSHVKAQSGEKQSSPPPPPMFYVIVGLALLLLMTIETRAGMFDSVNDLESELDAGSVPYLIDGIALNWGPSSPP